MKIDIDDLSTEELLELKKRIDERLKFKTTYTYIFKNYGDMRKFERTFSYLFIKVEDSCVYDGSGWHYITVKTQAKNHKKIKEYYDLKKYRRHPGEENTYLCNLKPGKSLMFYWYC